MSCDCKDSLFVVTERKGWEELQARVKELEAVQLAHREDAERHREENARLRKEAQEREKTMKVWVQSETQAWQQVNKMQAVVDRLQGMLPSYGVLVEGRCLRTELDTLRELDGEKKCKHGPELTCNLESCPNRGVV